MTNPCSKCYGEQWCPAAVRLVQGVEAAELNLARARQELADHMHGRDRLSGGNDGISDDLRRQ